MAGTNAIIDLSHHNGNVDLQKAKAAGIAGVIQKATQGTSFIDPTFATNRQKAVDAGLLFGAYHFGVGADGVEQAAFFLNTVQPNPDDMLILDFEANPQGPSMTLEEARAFVTYIYSITSRYPGQHSNGRRTGLHFRSASGASAYLSVRAVMGISQMGLGPLTALPARLLRGTVARPESRATHRVAPGRRAAAATG